MGSHVETHSRSDKSNAGLPLSTHRKRRNDWEEKQDLDRSREKMDKEMSMFSEQCHSSSLSRGESLVLRVPSKLLGSYNREAQLDAFGMHALTSSAHHSDRSVAFFHWPALLQSTAEDRAEYFNGLQKKVHSVKRDGIPIRRQATSLLDLMSIRAYHSNDLCSLGLGTAVGFRIRQGVLTKIPAIIVFVAKKVNKEWLNNVQRVIPEFIEGPGEIWCDVDVVEFSHYSASTISHKEQVYTELVEGLRGQEPLIGPGSQVASQEIYGTLGAIVQSRIGAYQVGFLTNRQVAVDLEFPSQKMFHPLPPNVAPGVYLGAVERETSYVADDIWYGIFASRAPESYVRTDGAFVPFQDGLDILQKVTTTVNGVGEMHDVMFIDLQAPIDSIIGKQVVKVGRGSGLTKGHIMAYAIQFNDEKGSCFFTDFLIVGEKKQRFVMEGDSGSLILMIGDENKKPRPIGIIWGGTGSFGRLKLQTGQGPEYGTNGVGLGHILEVLQLKLITSNDTLREAVEKHRQSRASCTGGPTASPRSQGYIMR